MRQLLWPLPSAEIRQLLCCVKIVVVGYCLALQKRWGSEVFRLYVNLRLGLGKTLGEQLCIVELGEGQGCSLSGL